MVLAISLPVIGYTSLMFNPWGDITTYYFLFKTGAIASIVANFLADLKRRWKQYRLALLAGLIINIPAVYIVVVGMFS